jgi:hypothetical protein
MPGPSHEHGYASRFGAGFMDLSLLPVFPRISLKIGWMSGVSRMPMLHRIRAKLWHMGGSFVRVAVSVSGHLD